MNKELLLDVVRAVEAVPEKQFNMEYWYNYCLTAGCAIGTYCTANPKVALALLPGVNGYAEVRLKNGEQLGGKLQFGFDAIMTYFDINMADAQYLFHPGTYSRVKHYVSKSAVIGRILKFVGEIGPVAIEQEEAVVV